MAPVWINIILKSVLLLFDLQQVCFMVSVAPSHDIASLYIGLNLNSLQAHFFFFKVPLKLARYFIKIHCYNPNKVCGCNYLTILDK